MVKRLLVLGPPDKFINEEGVCERLVGTTRVEGVEHGNARSTDWNKKPLLQTGEGINPREGEGKNPIQ